MHNLRAKCIGKNFKLIVIVRQGRRGDGAMGSLADCGSLSQALVSEMSRGVGMQRGADRHQCQ